MSPNLVSKDNLCTSSVLTSYMNFRASPSPKGYFQLPNTGVTSNLLPIPVCQVSQSKKPDLLAEPLDVSNTELSTFAQIT